MKPGKEPHAAPKPWVGQAWFTVYKVALKMIFRNSIFYARVAGLFHLQSFRRNFLLFSGW